MSIWRARDHILNTIEAAVPLVVLSREAVSRLALRIACDLHEAEMLWREPPRLTRWQHFLAAIGRRR